MGKQDLVSCITTALNLFQEVDGGIKISKKKFRVWRETCLSVLKNNRPRTTGKNSQNHYINGAIQLIANETGETDVGRTKLICKYEAISAGYPYRSIDGNMVPKSEAEITVKEASILIETINRIAAELNIRLEGKWNG